MSFAGEDRKDGAKPAKIKVKGNVLTWQALVSVSGEGQGTVIGL